jgi:chloramphenicol 3-O-phosphotransferase
MATTTDRFAPIILITGVMASGKSTVAQHLAEGLDRSVHLRGDVFRRMVVRGRVDMSADPSPEALHQLRLRYELACQAACGYSAAGFTVVHQDTIVGPALAEVVEMYRGRPLHVFLLVPALEVVRQREQDRSKTGYGRMTVEALQDVLASTPSLGIRIDNSEQSVSETARDIVRNMADARITWTQ